MISQPLTEQYRPKTLDELIGQDGLALELRRWMDSWVTGKPAYLCLFMSGPPGVGKTSAVFALANEYNLDVVEVNASDFRTPKELVKELWSTVYFTPSSDDKQNIILIDECDEITKSGFKTLEELILNSKCPIVLVCNDEYAVRKITTFYKDNALMIKFNKIKDYKLHMYISELAKKEGIKIPDINKLIEISAGDLRFAINNIDSTTLPTRDKRDDIFKIVASIMRGEWDGNIEDFKPEYIWYVVNANLEGFYNSVGPYSLSEFREAMDTFFEYIWRTISSHGKAAYKFWKYPILMMRMMPHHDKTAKIIIPKKELSDIRNNWIPESKRNKDIQEYASHCHMSYRKASSIFDYHPEMIEIYKNMPKIKEEEIIEVEFKPIEVEKPVVLTPSVKGIFDYSSD